MKIRLWRLGNTEHRIFPTDATINVLKNILSKVDYTKPVADIIWNDLASFKEIDLNVEETEATDCDINMVVEASFPVDKFREDFEWFYDDWKKENLS